MVNGVVIEMRRYRGGRHIICRTLHRGKGVDFLSDRQHYNTARMLSGGTAHAYTALHNTVDLTVSLVDAALLIVTLYKTKRGFIRQSTNGSRTECLPFSEDNLRVIVGLTLVLAREV